LFPLLTATVRRIADRTTRNRLSLGGNLAGNLPYREAALPLLLADAWVLTVRPPAVPGSAHDAQSERRERPLRRIFDKRVLLDPGEFMLGFSLPAEAALLPWKHYRATRTAGVDYPLATVCFLAAGPDGTGLAGTRPAGPARADIAAAVSGLHPFPVLFPSIAALRAAIAVPGMIKADQRASAEYRTALVLDMARRAEEELA